MVPLGPAPATTQQTSPLVQLALPEQVYTVPPPLTHAVWLWAQTFVPPLPPPGQHTPEPVHAVTPGHPTGPVEGPTTTGVEVLELAVVVTVTVTVVAVVPLVAVTVLTWVVEVVGSVVVEYVVDGRPPVVLELVIRLGHMPTGTHVMVLPVPVVRGQQTPVQGLPLQMMVVSDELELVPLPL